MGKPWVGYLAAGLFVIAGAFEFIGQKPVLGIIFLLVGVANVFIQIKLNKLKKGGK
jgi:hypothetical protein